MGKTSIKTEILRRLRSGDQSISGQEICMQLGVSRTAVWKAIHQLEDEGYVFEAIQNKGYRLVEHPDVLSKDEIESQLSETSAVRSVRYFETIDSTNNEAKREAENGAADRTLFVAEHQTNGRGRRGREWSSPQQTGIWMSLLLRPDLQPQTAPLLTIVTAISVVQAIQSVYKEEQPDCRIKWPNDIVLNGKKICGILTEMSAEPDLVHFVVIGVGINVNTQEMGDAIRDKASSLLLETGKKIERSTLIAAFSEAFENNYQMFLQTQQLGALQGIYNDMIVNLGGQVRVLDAKNSFEGTARGINERGELLVYTEDGTEIPVTAGEVSVRGLYGYV